MQRVRHEKVQHVYLKEEITAGSSVFRSKYFSVYSAKYTSEADEVYKEIEIMKRLNHPNVIKLHEIIYDDEEEKVYLIIDYCKYGDIIIWDSKKSVFIRKWSYREIAKYFKEIAAGLEYRTGQLI